MDYTKELRELLRPLGLYQVDGGVSGAELAGIGQALDEICGALETAETEAILVTAGDAGLSAWESLLPFTPACETEEARRIAIMALLRIDETSFTLAAINDTLAGCGITATVSETDTHQTVAVRFPGCRGIPAGFDALQTRIEQILPCHLNVEYLFAYLRWWEMPGLFFSWSVLAARAPCWDVLERRGAIPA